MRGRIPQAFLDDLLDRVDIVEVVDRRVKLKKTGKNYSACCPFHDEKTPSFTVNPDKQFYYCFGCGAGGNALGFLMDYENLDFPRAVETLASSAGLEVPREQGRTGPGSAEREQSNRQLYDLMEQVCTYYRRQLRQHPQANRAVTYLKQRGLTGEIAKQFDLGFAPPGWHNLQQALGDTPALQTLLKDSGMLVENEQGKLYDRFRDRVVFPIRDQRGRVVAFGGRVLGDDKPKYLNSPETELFHKSRVLYNHGPAREAAGKAQALIVAEGYMDVIALAQAGFGHAVAPLGTAITEDQLGLMWRIADEPIIALDGDKAGLRAAERLVDLALPMLSPGKSLRFCLMPEGRDPDDLIRAEGAGAMQRALDEAVSLIEMLWRRETAEPHDTPERRAALDQRLKAALGRLTASQASTLRARAPANKYALSGKWSRTSRAVRTLGDCLPSGSTSTHGTRAGSCSHARRRRRPPPPHLPHPRAADHGGCAGVPVCARHGVSGGSVRVGVCGAAPRVPRGRGGHARYCC